MTPAAPVLRVASDNPARALRAGDYLVQRPEGGAVLVRQLDAEESAALLEAAAPAAQEIKEEEPHDYAEADRINEAEMWGPAGRPQLRS